MAVAATTTYRVETLYDVTDRASKALQEIGAAAEKAGKSTEGLKATLVGIGAIGLAYKAFYAGKSALIDFNSEVERTKISLATVMSMNLSAPFALARKETDKLFERFQVMAAQSPATTQDFVNMANAISGAVLGAGLGMAGLERITKGAITAQAALGVPKGMLELDVSQMLAGTVAIRDRYARQLLAGIGETDYLKFNKYDTQKRARLTDKAFAQSSLDEGSKAMGGSFIGAASTLKDNIEIELGKVGLPLFQAVTKEIKSWNDWIISNKEQISLIGKSISDGLVTGFKYAKTAAEFLVNNAGTLMEIGKIWLMYKVAGGVGGSLTNAIGGAAGFLGGVGGGDKMSGLEKAIKSFGDKVGLYQSYGAGLAINKFGGLAGAAQNIGIGGALQIGVIAHELGEYLGVHRAITAAIDPQRVKYEQLISSMKMWDEALAKSRDRLTNRSGATGTVNYANASGASDFARLQGEAMKDALRILVDSQSGGLFEAASAKIRARERLFGGGLTADEAEKFMRSSQSEQAAMANASYGRSRSVQSTADTAAVMTETWINKAMGAFSAEERANIDLKEGTQRVYELIHRMLANPDMQFTFGKGIAGLDLLEVMAELRGSKNSLAGYQAKPPVTNIKIDRVEVAAKDPDRWIAELDAKARSMVRAPREAQASVRRGRQ